MGFQRVYEIANGAKEGCKDLAMVHFPKPQYAVRFGLGEHPAGEPLAWQGLPWKPTVTKDGSKSELILLKEAYNEFKEDSKGIYMIDTTRRIETNTTLPDYYFSRRFGSSDVLVSMHYVSM